MNIIIKCNEMTFEVAQRFSDRVLTTDGNIFFVDQYEPVLRPLAHNILNVLRNCSHLPYIAAWKICEDLSQGVEFIYSEAFEDAIASLVDWGLIEEIPEAEYRYRISRNSVTKPKSNFVQKG